MNFSPSERREIIGRAAEIVADRMLEAIGDPDALRRLPVPVACHLAGVTQRQLAKRCRIIRDGHRDHYVTLTDYKAAFLPPADPQQQP